MALSNGPVIIWLDDHIGVEGSNRDLKKLFADEVGPCAESDPVDALICSYTTDWRAVDIPLDATNKPEEVDNLIEKHRDKRIKFICSATLGQPIVPRLVTTYPNILSYYIFCGYMQGQIHWAIDYVECLQMFDHQDNLLERLTRDIASDFREHGEHFKSVDDPMQANQCFQRAKVLEERIKSRTKAHHVQDTDYKNAPF